MEKQSLDELRAVLSDIERALECSVCLETIRDSATVCGNGHGVCGKCWQTLAGTCPVCQTAFTVGSCTSHRLLNSIIRQMPRPCKNQFRGCDKIVSPSIQQDHNQELCEYQEVSCPIDCGWNGSVNDVLNHLETDHSHSSELFRAESEVFPWPGISLQPGFQFFLPIYAHGCLFLARAKMTEDSEIHLTFHLEPDRHPSTSFSGLVFFKRGELNLFRFMGVVRQKVHEDVPWDDRTMLTKTEVDLFTACTGTLFLNLVIIKDL